MLHDQRLHVKVTIVTVVFNAVDQIESTVRSVLAQTYDNVEYIVIDGGSTDGTLEVLARYRNKIANMVSEKDSGIYDAMNKGIAAATGEWIGIMNAGDVFPSDDVLSRVFAAGCEYDGVDVIYGDAVAIEGQWRDVCIAPEDVQGLACGPVYRHGASFVRRVTHLQHLFDVSLKERLGFALDFEQIHRMYKAGCAFRKVPVTIVDFARRGASTVSPFKPGYYNYLITHNLRCSPAMRVWLILLACWRKLVPLVKSFVMVQKLKLIKDWICH